MGPITIGYILPGSGLLICCVDPAELKGGQFNRVRFARDGSMALYTAVNCKGVGWLLHWAQTPSGDISLLSQRTCGDIVTAFDISPSGHALAIGHSEGATQHSSGSHFMTVA